MTYTREEWAVGLLQALGNEHPAPLMVEWVVSWTRFETAAGEGAAYNLLNTEGTAPGSTFFNHTSPTAGVQNFVNFQQGVETNARIVELDYYKTIAHCLKNNVLQLCQHGWSGLQEVNRELETWGTGPRAELFIEILGTGLQETFPGEGPGTPAPAARTYTVVPGDRLNSIAERFEEEEPILFQKNQALLDQVAREHGLASSEQGHWIFPGTVLTL